MHSQVHVCGCFGMSSSNAAMQTASNVIIRKELCAPIRQATRSNTPGSRLLIVHLLPLLHVFDFSDVLLKEWCWSLDDARFPSFEEQRYAQLLNQAAKALRVRSERIPTSARSSTCASHKSPVNSKVRNMFNAACACFVVPLFYRGVYRK